MSTLQMRSIACFSRTPHQLVSMCVAVAAAAVVVDIERCFSMNRRRRRCLGLLFHRFFIFFIYINVCDCVLLF